MKALSPLAKSYKEAFEDYLIVLDMDGTLWWFWLDTHISPPVRPYKMGVQDIHGDKFDFYPEVREILLALFEAEIPIALASSTWDPKLGKELIRLMKVDSTHTLNDIASYKELITCQKYTHFENIKVASGYDYKQMIFIDDEYHNIQDMEKWGVLCFYEKCGISKKVLEQIMESIKARPKEIE